VPANPAGGKEQKAQDEAGSQTTKKDGEAEFGLDGGGDDTDERPEQAKNQTFAQSRWGVDGRHTGRLRRQIDQKNTLGRRSMFVWTKP